MPGAVGASQDCRSGRARQRGAPRTVRGPVASDAVPDRRLAAAVGVMAGYFTDESLIRRVHREHAIALSGPRSLLMQAAHPVAFAGFFMSTGALEDPYPRL